MSQPPVQDTARCNIGYGGAEHVNAFDSLDALRTQTPDCPAGYVHGGRFDTYAPELSIDGNDPNRSSVCPPVTYPKYIGAGFFQALENLPRYIDPDCIVNPNPNDHVSAYGPSPHVDADASNAVLSYDRGVRGPYHTNSRSVFIPDPNYNIPNRLSTYATNQPGHPNTTSVDSSKAYLPSYDQPYSFNAAGAPIDSPASKADASMYESQAVLRITSTQLPHISRRLTVEVLNHLICNELRGAAATDSNTLVDEIFPDATLRITVDDRTTSILHEGTSPCMVNGRWTAFPDLGRPGAEKAVTDWLNSVVYSFRRSFGVRPARMWSAQHANTPIPYTHSRKPDSLLVPCDLVNITTPHSLKWQDAYGMLEITSANSTTRIIDTLCNKAFVVFSVQPHRRFLPALYIRQTSFVFIIFDRSGAVKSQEYHIHVDYLRLVRILIGLSFGSDQDIGFDPTVSCDDNASVESLMLSDVKYKVDRCLNATQSLRGRATHVWVVKDPTGKFCILKDCWIGSRRDQNEVSILKRVKGKRGFPNLIDGGPVFIDGKVDSTSWLRSHFPNFVDHRLHLRIVMEPIGKPLRHFRSHKELVGIFIDILEAHKYLCLELGFLHRDISYANILITTPRDPDSPNFDESRQTGMLIDFGYASKMSEAGDVDDGDRTGTAPFMAIEVLNINPTLPFRHRIEHDIESVFYVLLYVCLKMVGPRMWSTSQEQSPIDLWFEPVKTFDSLSRTKIAHMINFNSMLKSLPPYFQGFNNFLMNLRQRMFMADISPSRDFGNRVTHAEMLNLFETFYATLPDADATDNQPGGTGKRKQSNNQGSDFIQMPKRRRAALTWDAHSTSADNAYNREPGHVFTIGHPGEKIASRPLLQKTDVAPAENLIK